MKNMINEEEGSFVDPKEQRSTLPRTGASPAKDSNYRLWELLEQIRDAIKENSVAINNLVSTAFMNRSIPQQPDRPLPEPSKPTPHPLMADKGQPLPEKKVNNPIVKVEAMFTDEIANMLEFSLDNNNMVIIKPRMFLGSDVFAKVASIVREANGEYVSAGKGSHFKVPV